MSEKISWNFVVQALNGPSISGAGSLTPEAYETIDVTVPGITPPLTKKVTLPGAMSLLIIKPPAPTTPGMNITYKGTPAIPGEPVVLDGPHVFIGAGAIAFLGAATDLTFTNATGADTEIQILIGRTTA